METFVTNIPYQPPTEEELLKAFKKLSRQQKLNALNFGVLSDAHICELRDIIRREKSFRASHKKVFYRKVLTDIMRCSQYTGFHSFHSEDKKEASKGYPAWRKAIAWFDKLFQDNIPVRDE